MIFKSNLQQLAKSLEKQTLSISVCLLGLVLEGWVCLDPSSVSEYVGLCTHLCDCCFCNRANSSVVTWFYYNDLYRI